MEDSNNIYFGSCKHVYGFLNHLFVSFFNDPDFPNITFNSIEQYMAYNKILLFKFDNKQLLQDVLNEKNPKQISSYFKTYFQTNNIPKISDDWEKIKYDIVFKANMLKFSQNQQLKDKLLIASRKHIYAAFKSNNYWGIGFSPEEAFFGNKRKFGENVLGKILMQVAAILQKNTKKAFKDENS
jgi:ribA/ribD-fused uncharacterized protein